MPAPDRSRAMEHIVVALFENRSLDNVLGHLYGPGDGKDFDGVIGGPHGQETAQDPHRLPPLPRLHPRQPRRERGISRWRAQRIERCPLGSEGGCAEKARVQDS